MTTPLDSFAKLERDGWERVAHKYDNAWSSLTRLFIPHLLQAIQITKGMRLLDIASGPGYVAEAARLRGANPTGVDFSEAMVRIAKERHPEIEFVKGDAQALDFDDNSFDALTMNFGLLHLPDPPAAFAEASRVLRTGGRYGFTVWASPDQSPGAKIVDDAVKAYADMSHRPPQGPDYFGYGDPDFCRQTLSKFDFDPESMSFQTITEEWEVPTASFLFESESGAGVRTAALLAAQQPEVLEKIRKQIEDSVRPYERGGGFALPFAAHLVAISRR